MPLFGNKKQRVSFRQPKIYSPTTTEKNPVRISKGIIWMIVLIAGILALGWWLFASSFFKIKNIDIQGTLNTEVQKELDSFRGKNIFLFSLGQLDKKLAKNQSSIENLNIIKGIPDTLKVEVLVRRPQIQWRTQDITYFIDDVGVIFNLDNPNEELNKLPIVTDGKNLAIATGQKIVTSDFVKLMNTLPGKINDVTGKNIESMTISETTNNLDIKLKDGYLIKFDTVGNIDDELFLLKKIKEAHESGIKEYVDLRVEGKAYYK